MVHTVRTVWSALCESYRVMPLNHTVRARVAACLAGRVIKRSCAYLYARRLFLAAVNQRKERAENKTETGLEGASVLASLHCSECSQWLHAVWPSVVHRHCIISNTHVPATEAREKNERAPTTAPWTIPADRQIERL